MHPIEKELGGGLADAVAPIDGKLKKAVKSGQLPALLGLELIEAGASAGILDEDEAGTMREYDKLIMSIIYVDEFAYDAFSRETSVKKPAAKKKKAKTTRRKTTSTKKKTAETVD